MRVLGVDYGRRRVGLALSDPSGLLASPWRTIQAGQTPGASATILAKLLADADDDEVGSLQTIVVGLPRRLNGEDNEQTVPTRVFAAALAAATGATVHLQDERLSSHEAESQLAVRERDWRARKARLDAAAAAVILQDYLDAQPRASLTSDAD